MARSLPPRRELTQKRARQLRLNSAPAEQLVWSILRDRQLAGLKFRRQVAIGPYIADFLCHDVKLVVELDGESHEYRIQEDAERTEYLQTQGLRVLRIANEDVFTNLESVAIAILRETGGDVTTWLTDRKAVTERKTPSP